MEQTISSIDLYDTSSSGLVNFFNDPNSAIIFLLGIFVSSIFIIACTKLLYGPKKVKPKPVVKAQPKSKPRKKPAPKQGTKQTQQRRPRKPKTQTK